jgi:signal transduction histidine kinase
MGYMELLESMLDLDDTKQRFMNNSMKELKSISLLVDNIRSIIRLREEPFEPEKVDLATVLDKAREQALYQMEGKELTINNDLDKGDVSLKVDRFVVDLFDQVLQNSLKFDDSEEVVVDVEHEFDEGWTILGLADHGPGIKDDRKNEVFDRFNRLVEDGDIHGSGMGLSLVKEILKRYGGEVWIEDRVRGQQSSGCRIKMRLPTA